MTCGGICPGMNVVIRELVMAMRYNYGVSEIYGIKWGFHGFLKENFWVKLNPEDVKHIHLLGGTVLGTSRYGFEGNKIADILIKKKIDMVFFIGGDGTHSGMMELSNIFKARKKKIIFVGIPKSIDNDLPIIDKSFGLESAIQESVRTIRAANVEANCNMNGIGLVKLFGRSSGFLAMLSSLAARDVNICLIPEIPFNLYGENGLLDFLFKRIEVKEHCVIVVADGARFSVKDYKPSKDRSIDDIGLLLKREIIKKSEELGIEVNLKLMDLTYVVRAVPANEYDCNLCAKLAESAVHCAFAGFTNFSVGLINNKPCMIPSELLCGKNKRKISYNSDDYLMLLASTGQPSFYPEKVEEKEPDNKKEKISDTTNEDKMKDIKNTIEENKINKEEEEKKNIFNFH
jgi:6-phosphofructokinase 1